MTATARRRWRRTDDGQVTAFVVALTLGILALTGLTLDGGLALAASTRARGQAEAAARAGAQAVDVVAFRATGTLRLVPSEAADRAWAHLHAEGVSGAVTASADSVTVTVTAQQPTQLLSLVGITTITVHGRGTARPQDS
jgi:hypothetical protein